MKEPRIASRYAKSLIGLAIEQGKLEEVYADMSLLSDVCASNRDLTLLLKSPIINADKKIKIFEEIFSGKFGIMSMKFVDTIIRKRREVYLESIVNEFVVQYKQQKNILTAEVTSAMGIDDAIRSDIYKIINEASLGKNKAEIEIIEKENKELIGGLILRVGDKQVDASILRKLRDLNKSFQSAPHLN